MSERSEFPATEFNVRRTISLVAPVALLVAFVIGVAMVRLPLALAQRSSDYAMLDPVVDVQHLIASHFFKDLKDEDLKSMQEGAIRGMLEALNDPYTEYIPAEAIPQFDKDVRGEYAGVGAQVNGKDGWLQIVSPMEDSPAYRMGVEADDLIVAIDSKSIYGLPVDAIISNLTGKAGSTVRVTIERVGRAADVPPAAKPPSVPGPSGDAPGPKPGSVRFDLEVVRERIVAPTVKGVHRVGDKWAYMIDPERKIAYIRVTQFTAGTIPELEQACRQLVGEGMQGMILDLRFNGGGALFAAIQMADLFLKDGVIVSTKGRTTREEKVYAKGEGTLPDFPLVVVLNESSASASEVVSGALADNQRAVILGTRSFGKGIVQTVYRLPSGTGQLKVTEQYYYLPSGRCLQRSDDSPEWGVDPTPGFYVPMTTAQYREMLRARRDDEVIRNNRDAAEEARRWSDPAWILEHLKDLQLSAAVEAIRAKIEAGQWKPTGQEAPKGKLELAELRREQKRTELILRELARSEKRIAALTAATGEKAAPEADLIPGTEDLTGGKVQVFDAKGNAVATLKITGPDLERWLSGAPVEPEAAPADK